MPLKKAWIQLFNYDSIVGQIGLSNFVGQKTGVEREKIPKSQRACNSIHESQLVIEILDQWGVAVTLNHKEMTGSIFAFYPWCPWCSRYRRRKWTRRCEFKSWTRLIAFHIALIPLGKVWIQLFSLQLWVNSRTD